MVCTHAVSLFFNPQRLPVIRAREPGANVPGVVTAAVVNNTATRVGITGRALLKAEDAAETLRQSNIEAANQPASPPPPRS